VGGELTGRLFAALPRGSVVRVYGMLSDEACRIEGAPLVFEDKRLEGFTMYQWLRTTSLFRQLRTMRKVQGLLGDVLQTKVRARFGLDQCDDALAAVREGTSDGKVLLVPDRLL